MKREEAVRESAREREEALLKREEAQHRELAELQAKHEGLIVRNERTAR